MRLATIRVAGATRAVKVAGAGEGGEVLVDAIRLTVDGVVMQHDTTADLLFDPVTLVEYISAITRLTPVTSSRPARQAASAAPASRRASSLAARW